MMQAQNLKLDSYGTGSVDSWKCIPSGFILILTGNTQGEPRWWSYFATTRGRHGVWKADSHPPAPQTSPRSAHGVGSLLEYGNQSPWRDPSSFYR